MSHTIAPILGEATVQELRESVHGQVITPGDDGYAEACQVWNGTYQDRRPAVIVQCAGAADVITAVGFARSNGLPLAVRGGGHSIAGFSTCDDGIVIDLSNMRDVHVDPVARRAEVGGGAVWADVDHETQAHGLERGWSSTGVPGSRSAADRLDDAQVRLACDNLVAADVVTADGRLVRASETSTRPAVGLRGGGGNFGIVTRFEFDCTARPYLAAPRPSTHTTYCGRSASGPRTPPTTSPRSST